MNIKFLPSHGSYRSDRHISVSLLVNNKYVRLVLVIKVLYVNKSTVIALMTTAALSGNRIYRHRTLPGKSLRSRHFFFALSLRDKPHGGRKDGNESSETSPGSMVTVEDRTQAVSSVLDGTVTLAGSRRTCSVLYAPLWCSCRTDRNETNTRPCDFC